MSDLLISYSWATFSQTKNEVAEIVKNHRSIHAKIAAQFLVPRNVLHFCGTGGMV
jgi:hypothetical protein